MLTYIQVINTHGKTLRKTSYAERTQKMVRETAFLGSGLMCSDHHLPFPAGSVVATIPVPLGSDILCRKKLKGNDESLA